jgi:gliding motility-associated-like protein
MFVLEGGVITISATASGNNLQYKWTPSTYLNSATLLNPFATPLKDIRYILTVTGEGDCTVRDSMKVTVLKSPVIPNAFSPNGDGINDNWMIRYLDTYTGCVMEVYDRYGQLVYRSVGYSKPWDGTRNGKPLPVGVYFYILDTKKHDKPFTGSVTLIR